MHVAATPNPTMPTVRRPRRNPTLRTMALLASPPLKFAPAPLLLADPIDFALDDEFVEGCEWQAHEEHDSSVKDGKRFAEGALDFLRWSVDLGGVGHSPVGRQRMAEPKRADLAGRPVANGKDEVHLRGIRGGELVPALTAQPFRGHPYKFDLADCLGTNPPRWVAAGAIRGEVGAPLVVHDGFGHDRARGIPGAKEEYVEGHFDGSCWGACAPQARRSYHKYMRLCKYTIKLLEMADPRYNRGSNPVRSERPGLVSIGDSERCRTI